MEKDQSDTCQVCFIKPLKLFEYSKLVKCIKCNLTCHRSCYNPSHEGSKFICDSCDQNEEEAPFCFICGNLGLLKKVEDKFAHPICLLFSPMVIVTQYSKLQFAIVKEEPRVKKDKKFKCKVCKNSGNLEKCCQTKCQNFVHMYCAWKSYNGGQLGGWNHNPITENLEYSSYFDKKSRDYLTIYSPTLVNYMGSLPKSKLKIRQFYMVCPDHVQNMFECCENPKYFGDNGNGKDIDFIQCDQCLKWYHEECLDPKTLPKVRKEDFQYTCQYCHQFYKIIKKGPKNEIYMEKIPRFNICELIFIQYLFEQKNYALTSQETKFLFQIPIDPSLSFIEHTLKKNIIKKLKISVFESMCQMKLEFRIQKKQFKANFTKNLEKALMLIVERKSLRQMSENSEDKIQEEEKSEKILDEEQKQLLASWISLLNDFKAKFQEFDKVVSKLNKKLKKWIKSLDSESDYVKKCQEDSQNSYVKIQQEGSETKREEVKQEIQSSSEQDQQKESRTNLKTTKIIKNEQSSDKIEIGLFDDNQIKGQFKPIIDYEKEKYLLQFIRFMRQKVSSEQINPDLIYERLAKENNNKEFYFSIILNSNLSDQSALKFMLLEVAFQSFLKIQETMKASLNKNLLEEEGHSQTEIFFEKDLLKIKCEKKLKFLEGLKDKLMEIYYESNSQVKRQFNARIQYFVSQMSDMIGSLLKQDQMLQNKIDIQEALHQYMTNPHQKNQIIKKIKQQVNSSMNFKDLAFLRLSIQKFEVYQKIKKIKFTHECSSKMGAEYQDFCKTSSEINPKESGQTQKEKQINLREETLLIQKNSLRIWLKMFQYIFQLSNQFISLKKKFKLDNIEQENSNSNFSVRIKEPLETIEQTLQFDYSQKPTEYQKLVTDRCLNFLFKISKAKIDWKIFHQNLIKTIQKIGEFCIILSFENIESWASNELKFILMRNVYKQFRNSSFLNEKAEMKQLFTKNWEIFQADQLFQTFLKDNKDALFNNPEYTEYLDVERIPEMLKFYKETGLLCRATKTGGLKLWTIYYFKFLKKFGFDRLVDEAYKDSPLRLKYEKPEKISFHQFNSWVGDLDKIKFPQCAFSEKIKQIFKEADKIQIQLQDYFKKNGECIDRSFQIKQHFMKTKNLQTNCIKYSEELHRKEFTLSTQDLNNLIETLEINSVSDIITFEIEKRVILEDRADFEELVLKAQQILNTSDTEIPIIKMNEIFFKIISYPFRYQNLPVFHLHIQESVERQLILNTKSQSQEKITKNKKIVESVQMIYQNILASFEPQKMSFQNRLTREQIMAKVNQIENYQQFKQIIAHPGLKQMREKIHDTIEQFDQIKESSEMIVQKVNDGILLSMKEIQALSESLNQYKQQRVYELGFDLLFHQVDIYKLVFLPIPENIMDMQVLLEQFKSLKQSFRTKELVTKIKELEQRINQNK